MRLHLPKTLLAALLACFAALPECASGAATIVTFGNAGGITGVTTDAFNFNNVGKASETLTDGTALTIIPTGGFLYSGSGDGAIKGNWSNSAALNTMNTTLGLSGNTPINATTLSAGSTSYYTASGNGGSTSRLTLRLSGDVLVGSEITFFVTATARTGNLSNFSAAGLQGSSTTYAVNDGDGFSDTATFSDDGAGSLTLIKYTGTVGADRTVTFNSTTGKNGWQMLAYNVTSEASVSYLTWNGTDAAKAWNTSDANWQDGNSQDSLFSSGAYVRFTSDAANKTAVIDSAITAGAIDVLDDYTFSFGESGSLEFDALLISEGKTLTKDGAGTWALGGKTVVGDFKVAEGRVTSSGIFDGNVAVAGGNLDASGTFKGSVTVTGGQITLSAVSEDSAAASINGNLTIDGGNVTYTTTFGNAYNKFGGNVSVKKGTLKIDAATNNGQSIIKAGSTVNIGESGKLVLKGHDLLGWSTDKAPKEIILQGSAGENAEDKSKYAVLDIQDSGNSFTFAAPLKLNGYTKVTGTEFNTNGSAITISAEGADNTIKNTIAVRYNLTVNVAEQGKLIFEGNLNKHSNVDADTTTTPTVEKTGAGTLIISGASNSYDKKVTVSGGELNLASDLRISQLSIQNGSSLTIDAGKTTTITSNAAASGLVLNEAGTSKVILKGQSEPVSAGGKLVYDDFTYQASGKTDAEIIGNKDTAFKLWDAFKSISNATIALNSGASEAKTIGGGDTSGVLNNVTLSNNSTYDLTVSSTAAGKLSIINNDGGVSTSGTGTIIDKMIKNTTRTDVDSSTPTFSSYDRVEAVTGNVEIYKVGAQVNVADMVIGAGRTISVYQGDDTSTKSTVLLGGLATDMTTLTAGSDAVLNANLLMCNTELTLSGALTLNGSLEMYGMKLMATDYMHWNNIDKDGVLTLFNGVTSIVGFTDGVDASTVFTNLGTGDFTLKYNADGGIVQIVANQAVPEPTTATLSMLALAGLMARRRRRKA